MQNEIGISSQSDRLVSLAMDCHHKVLTSKRFMTSKGFPLRKDCSTINISSVGFMENLVITRHEIENTEITINRFFQPGDQRNAPLRLKPIGVI